VGFVRSWVHCQEGTVASKPIELRIEASSDKYDAGDPNWRAQVSQLLDSLHGAAGTVHRVEEPVEGKKGGLEAIILALGSAGAFTVALEAFKAWLRRDQTRTVTISVKRNGEEQTVTLSSNRLDQDEFMSLARAAWNDDEA